METNTLILLSFKMLDLKLQLGLFSLCLWWSGVFSTDYRAVAVGGHYPPPSSLLPMWWQALKKSFTQLEAQGPQTSEACARPPWHEPHRCVQYCLFTSLPPIPSLFPSFLALPLFFSPAALWHALSRSVRVFSSSFEVWFHSGQTQLIKGVENMADIFFVHFNGSFFFFPFNTCMRDANIYWYLYASLLLGLIKWAY